MLTFSSIVGHRRVTTLLAQAIARDTLPPTLLLAGAAGVGKYEVARAAAAALNCLAPRRDVAPLALDACGECRSCQRIERNVHVDVITLEPDDRASIKIDVVREVLERTGFRPFEGRRRVVLIRDADTLEAAAQNALLKSLEEPPPATVFLLTTAVPGKLLPTVRSRCMRLRFGQLTEREVAEVLVARHGIDARAAQSAAALADGRVGTAMTLNATDVAVLRELALLLLRQAGSNAPLASRLQAAATVAVPGKNKERPREEVALVLRFLASMLRDLELLNTTGGSAALANPVVADDLQSLARRFTGDRARHAFVATDRALAALERNAGVKVVADWLSVQL